MIVAAAPREVAGTRAVGRRAAFVLVLAAAMALLAGEPYTWPELAADPGSLPLLAAMYVGYALTVRGLSARFRWSPGTLVLFGALAGVVLEGFFHRSFFADEPLLFGVNWLTVLVMTAYWGVLTTALAVYAAGRVMQPPPARPKGPLGLAALAAWWLLLLAVWAANLPPLPEEGVAPVALLALALLGAVVASSRAGRRDSGAPRSRLLDVSIAAYVAAESVSAVAAAPRQDVRIALWILSGLVLAVIGLVTLVRGRRQAQPEE